MQELLPRLSIALSEESLDPAGLFAPRRAACWLEIGFGAGEHLAAQALAHPEVGFIGCEPFVNGIARLLSSVDAHKMQNLRIYADDARPLLHRIQDASIDRVFLLFPDPWPKKRHAGRRFICPENLDALARIMRDDAEFRVASDEMGYIRWSLRHIRAHAAFDWTARSADDWRARGEDWPPTRYEEKALAAGRQCVYLKFTRRKRAQSLGDA